MSTVKRDAQAYTVGLSINENLKLEKGKEKSSSAARRYIQSSGHVTATCHHVTAVYQCRNSDRKVLPSSANAVTLPPPSAKACPQALYVRFILIGCSYLHALLVAYYLYYTSIPSIYLGTLAV